MKCLNLGCGPIYVKSEQWINVDFSSSNDGVVGLDLLKPLPFESQQFDLVYSSHFLEHIPKNLISSFLGECKRVLKPGGVIRLVLPDCEEMFAAYLDFRRKGEHQKADFLIIEIVDQCVRSVPGGQLGNFYDYVRAIADNRVQQDWAEFVFERNGEILSAEITASICKGSQVNGSTCIKSRPLLRRILEKFQKIPRSFRLHLHNIGIKLLEPAFYHQNVSFCSVGEKHQWLWDFYQIRDTLEKCGFCSVTRESHLKSRFASFPFFPLDAVESGFPRKGKESIFIEAVNEPISSPNVAPSLP